MTRFFSLFLYAAISMELLSLRAKRRARRETDGGAGMERKMETDMEKGDH